LTFGQSIDKIAAENPIVFGSTKSHRYLVGGQGVLLVMSNIDPMDMKFGMVVEFDALNNYPKFGCDQLISCPVRALAKNSPNPFPLGLQ